jgi:hypothetical protein
MKTQKIMPQAISFQGGKKQLPTKTIQELQKILLNMNSQTEYKSTSYSFESKILSGLKSKLGNIIDASAIVRPTNEIYEGRAKIEAKRLEIEIMRDRGEKNRRIICVNPVKPNQPQ